MKTRKSLLLAWLLAAVTAIAFFLPWARVVPGSGIANSLEMANRLVAGEDSWVDSYLGMRPHEWKAMWQKPAEGLSGYQLVLSSGEKTSEDKITHGFLIMFTGDGDVGWKIRFLPLLPVLSIAGAILMSMKKISVRGLALVTLAQAGLYFFMRWKMDDAYGDRLLWQLELNLGLWLSLYALLALSVLQSAKLLMPKSKW